MIRFSEAQASDPSCNLSNRRKFATAVRRSEKDDPVGAVEDGIQVVLEVKLILGEF